MINPLVLGQAPQSEYEKPINLRLELPRKIKLVANDDLRYFRTLMAAWWWMSVGNIEIDLVGSSQMIY